MNILRVSTILTTVAVSVVCINVILAKIADIDPTDQAIILMCFLTLWFSAEMGLFAIHNILGERRAKKIQQELDMERSFREMGDKQ